MKTINGYEDMIFSLSFSKMIPVCFLKEIFYYVFEKFRLAKIASLAPKRLNFIDICRQRLSSAGAYKPVVKAKFAFAFWIKQS